MSNTMNRRQFLEVTGATAAAGAISLIAGGMPSVSAADEFYALDGLAQAELVRSGDVTALELLEAALARAESLNPKLNAIVHPMYERARARASEALPSGPFSGVPTLLKDLIDYEGVRTGFGSHLMDAYVGTDTHPLSQRMEEMGMVILGKSTTPEFGLLPTTESVAVGPTNNPWKLTHSPGGSSGGTAAAVAAGIVPLAQGSDGGGSIRVPASNCGLFGMKPSRGRVINAPGPARPGDLSVRGFLTRSVRDSQAGLAAITDPASSMPAVDDLTARGEPFRIAYATRDLNGVPAHPEVAKAIRHTAMMCEDLGHQVSEAMPLVGGDKFTWAMLTLWSNTPWTLVETIKKQTGSRPPRAALEPWTWGLIEYMDTQDHDAAIKKALEIMREATAIMASFFTRYDMMLWPVMKEPPVLTGDMGPTRDYDSLYDRVVDVITYTPLANATGVPAMSVPLHWTSEDLPVGSQFIAPLGEERRLYRLARQLEQAKPWADKWPRTSAKYL